MDNYERRNQERQIKQKQQIKKRKINRLLVLIGICLLIASLLIAGITKAVKSKKEKLANLTVPAVSESVKVSEIKNEETATQEAETEETKTETTKTAATEKSNTTKAASPKADISGMFSVPQGYSQKYCIAVNRATNTVTIYGKSDEGKFTKPVKAMVCSVGLNGGTPTGQFKTYDYFGEKWCRMVDATYGRYALRIHGSIMFHSVTYTKNQDKSSLQYNEYNKLGSAASHGCVRLSVADAKWLTENTSSGTIVKIFDGTSSSDPLGKPTPKKIDVNSANRGWDPTDPQMPKS